VIPAIAPDALDRPPPTLHAQELTLRPWRPSDAANVATAYQDPAIQRWHARSLTEVEAVEWIASMRQRWVSGTGISWAVLRGAELVGHIGFKAFNLADGVAETTYWIVAPARGHNIAPRALLISCQWMFDAIGFRRLELRHSTLNGSSCRVAAKTGFTAEGVLRQQARHADGWHDMHLHARLAGDQFVSVG
jgi:[ribosomal protein S5]-alanine N-acetyltransferase